ncbi:MAG: hypothetical protein MZV70_11600 [Desulfobacterales bacterium]|nr:hypothetical protein [Desulfobacterales bacterium]
MIEFTISGNKLAGRCRRYLQDHGLPIDYQGKNRPYDLVVTCSDVYLQKNIRDNRIVLVQEGITDPESMMFHLVKRLRFLPRWLGGYCNDGPQRCLPGFLRRKRGISRLFHPKRRAPREDRRYGNTQFR